MKTKKFYLCSFADSRMPSTLERVAKQAKDFGEFEEVFLYDESKLDVNFRTRHKDKLILGSRGYGYWVWKPYIILQSLEKMPSGSILLYMDAGCHLNPDGKDAFYGYIEAMERTGLLCADTGCLEKQFTKGDVFEFFNAKKDKSITDSSQIAATFVFIENNDETQALIKEWLSIMENHFSLVDDTPSITENFEEFVENRHDQSIFSILIKRRQAVILSAEDAFEIHPNNPIWVKWDKKLKFKHRFALKRLISLVFNKLKK